MMGKLWAFGDSYTAGHELGTGIAKEDVSKWLQDRIGISDIHNIKNILSQAEYHTKVTRPWYEYINHKHTPSLTYVGLIATANDLEHVNCAVSGSSIQYFYNRFMMVVNDIDWDNDTVIFGVPPATRWVSHNNVNRSYNNVSIIAPTCTKEIMPSKKMISLTNMSLLRVLQIQYPKLIVLDLGMNDEIDTNAKTFVVYNNKERIDDIADSLPFGRYPGFHPTEEAHEIFADYLLKEVL